MLDLHRSGLYVINGGMIPKEISQPFAIWSHRDFVMLNERSLRFISVWDWVRSSRSYKLVFSDAEVIKIHRRYSEQTRRNSCLCSNLSRGYRQKVMTNKSSFIARKMFPSSLSFALLFYRESRWMSSEKRERERQASEIREANFYAFKVKLDVVYFIGNVFMLLVPVLMKRFKVLRLLSPNSDQRKPSR